MDAELLALEKRARMFLYVRKYFNPPRLVTDLHFAT